MLSVTATFTWAKYNVNNITTETPKRCEHLDLCPQKQTIIAFLCDLVELRIGSALKRSQDQIFKHCGVHNASATALTCSPLLPSRVSDRVSASDASLLSPIDVLNLNTYPTSMIPVGLVKCTVTSSSHDNSYDIISAYSLFSVFAQPRDLSSLLRTTARTHTPDNKPSTGRIVLFPFPLCGGLIIDPALHHLSS